jgi:hypothetical protein
MKQDKEGSHNQTEDKNNANMDDMWYNKANN